ncbi:MAG: PBP1A family penicillin-binding protein [Deltaproteobacteria bacterium]|nr:PBP1A family penicillin-binding protein [Deltaproteobacteria bacterium]
MPTRKKTARKKKSRKWPRRSLLIALARIVVTGSFAAAFLLSPYCLYLSMKIEDRFSGRRWDIPSRVFSDTQVLMTGQGINIDAFRSKLKALGYRETPSKPRQKGEMKLSAQEIDIFLHDLKMPGLDRPGFPVRISVGSGEIKAIRTVPRGKNLPMIELEPEEVMLFYGDEHERRRLITLNQAPRHLINAVLAAEDNSFFSHYGLDPFGIMRALFVNLLHGGIVQGGSTITQQLAKNYFLTSQRTMGRKLNEMLIALIIETKYEKNQILEMYMNEIYLGQKGSASINGFGEAAFFYFGRQVGDLTLSECAVLAGLIKSPGQYSPFAGKKNCTQRRDAVLAAMAENGMITDAELKAAQQADVRTAAYSPANKKAPYFMDHLAQQLRDMYPPEVLSGMGLSIYTTIDMQVQTAAEQALARGLERLEKAQPRLRREDAGKKLQGAVVVMDPKSGAIKALAGGRDYGASQFNRITQARRQPGSAFKPFVYLSGLDVCTPATILSNEPRTMKSGGRQWTPKNYEDIPEAQLTMRESLARSVNLTTIDLAMRAGLSRIIRTARQFDFSTPLAPTPSMVLGASEVIPLELARAYCAFASGGVLPVPFTLKKVIDENGAVLALRHMSAKRVIPQDKAYIMNSLLRSVVTEGTARGLAGRGFTQPAAGKTGTTNDSRDAWFVGYTPDLLALVWVGFDGGDSIRNTGASAALPIWADLMRSVPQCLSGAWFSMPEGVIVKTVCKESGQLARGGCCPLKAEEVFLADRAPSEICTLHQCGPVSEIIDRVKNFFNPF